MEGGEWDGDELGGRERVGVVGRESGEGGVVLEDCAGGFGAGGEGEETGGFFKDVARAGVGCRISRRAECMVGRTYPILESSVSSKILNLNRPSARTSWVWPPERRRMRNGNSGAAAEVRRGVSAWACCKE